MFGETMPPVWLCIFLTSFDSGPKFMLSFCKLTPLLLNRSLHKPIPGLYDLDPDNDESLRQPLPEQ